MINKLTTEEKGFQGMKASFVRQTTTYEIFKEYVDLKNTEINVPKKAPLFEYTILYDKLFDRYAKIMCLANKVVLCRQLFQEKNEDLETVAKYCLKESKKLQKTIEAIEKACSQYKHKENEEEIEEEQNDEIDNTVINKMIMQAGLI